MASHGGGKSLAVTRAECLRDGCVAPERRCGLAAFERERFVKRARPFRVARLFRALARRDERGGGALFLAPAVSLLIKFLPLQTRLERVAPCGDALLVFGEPGGQIAALCGAEGELHFPIRLRAAREADERLLVGRLLVAVFRGGAAHLGDEFGPLRLELFPREMFAVGLLRLVGLLRQIEEALQIGIVYADDGARVGDRR